MKNWIRQFISFVLPVTALIIVPLSVEKNISIKNLFSLLTGLLIISVGLYAMIRTIATFIMIGKGTLAPWSPARRLVITGMHGYVRNPMIMGVLTVLIGESIAVMSFNIFTWAITFFIINNIYFILYEEPDLEKRFGDEYRDYKSKVSRWMPGFKPYEPDNKLT